MPTSSPMSLLRRRDLLATAAILLGAGSADARNLGGVKPWTAGAASPPEVVRPGPWRYFTPEEAAAVEAIADRLIPADDLSIGGREAGCGVFIDAQLAGDYGRATRLYMRPPFAIGTPMQGFQGPLTPAAQYRVALAALDAFCRAGFAGKNFAALAPEQQDKLLTGLETGQTKLDGADGRAFFELILQNTMEGFLADPIYGGNKGMAGWKMIGFPGARYDYREYIAKHNEPFPLPPVGIAGRPAWNPGG
jgi:gluconate 2-dehydrogenase gamma chain